MAFLMNSLPFAKPGGLAVMLGASRRKGDNAIFAVMMVLLAALSTKAMTLAFLVCLAAWRKVCLNVFGGITGDLLGAFVEVSEAVMMAGMVIAECT